MSMIGVAKTNDSTWEVTVDADMDTFATAPYVKIDDECGRPIRRCGSGGPK
jgi:hypothetical protein